MHTRTLDVPGAHITYDVRGPLPATDGRPILLMIGQPMDAGGFATLAGLFPERTVVTYDPRGLGRSTRTDRRRDNNPEVQAPAPPPSTAASSPTYAQTPAPARSSACIRRAPYR
jgi:pimeloyl-ACP methyl ester carboxylesterase